MCIWAEIRIITASAVVSSAIFRIQIDVDANQRGSEILAMRWLLLSKSFEFPSSPQRM